MQTTKQGITIIITTFERMNGLQALLQSLLKQNLRDLDLEIFICNNSCKNIIKKTTLTKLGRLLKKFKDVKIINSSHNWYSLIRYQIATLGKYSTIMFIDDDFIILDKNFIYDMYMAYKKLKPSDILSCHCKLWTNWTDNYLEDILMRNRTKEITEITQADIAGPGFSMFSKNIIMHPNILNLTPTEFPKAYDMTFSLEANKNFDSNVYYFPATGKLGQHADKIKHSLALTKNYEKDKFAVFKKYLQNGYEPVLSHLPQKKTVNTSPEQKAIKAIKPERHEW